MKVFISYSRIDASETAKVIHKYLTDYGHNEVFIDTSNIPYGDDWKDVIQKEISNCDIFVIIVTPSALYRSEVEKEVKLAKTLKKKIIPCIAKDYVDEDEIKWELNNYQGFFYVSDSKLAMDLHTMIKREVKTQRKTSGEVKTEIKTDEPSTSLEKQISIDTDSIQSFLEKSKSLEEFGQNSKDHLSMTTSLIRILFLSANPAQTDPLDLISEYNLINQKSKSSAGRELFKLEQRHDISIKSLIEELINYDPQILHFSGHGSDKSALIFKNENTGQIEEVPQPVLSEVFKVLGKEIDLVFLNACYSEKQARAIAEHVNCVIRMSDAIYDTAAIEFASTFYLSLSFNKSVKEAFDLAIAQLGLLSLPEYAIPKLIVKEDIDPSKIFIPAIMTESSKYIPEAISLSDRSITLANDIKIYLTPQYKDAAIALFKIIGKLLDTFQNILELYHGFEDLDLKNTEKSKEEFLNFNRRFFKFRTGKEHNNLNLLCDDIGKIYRAKLDKPLREWFTRDPSKLHLAKEHFDEAEKIDMIFSQFIDEILGRLKETVRSIKNDYINGHDYIKAQEKQKVFFEWSNNYLDKLEDQTNRLTKLREELLNSAGIISQEVDD